MRETIITNLCRVVLILGVKGFLNWVPDKVYLSICYRRIFGKWLDWNNPSTYNEKIQWLKIHNRKEVFTKMADKIEAKNYVSERIGEQYVIPTLGKWDSFDEINFNELPEKFVLKCNHDSGGVIICENKIKLNKKEIKKSINKKLKKNFYYLSREWPYKNITPHIFAEPFLESEEEDLYDYKFFCFNGEVKYILVCSERNSNTGLKETFFDTDWNKCDFGREAHPSSNKEISPPANLKKMIELSNILSKELPFLRVDFYEVQGKVLFGELTFFPAMGWGKFSPNEFDAKLGELLDLTNVVN